jgi:alkylated DNA repair dioxygenase AlkB
MRWTSSNNPNDIFGEYKSGAFTAPQPNNDVDKRYALIVATILNAINLCVADYSKSLNKDLGFLPNEVTIRKYFPPAQMGPHIDCEEDDDEARLTASIVLYLNDDYVGGDLAFPEQDIKIKPEAGSLVIFPSVKPYFHASTPLVSGNKYMCPAFMFKRSKIIS